MRVQAPAKPAGEASRSLLRLALVVDRSGSMDGEPLVQALRCVGHIVSRLQPSDQVAVVLYDQSVQVSVKLQRAQDAGAIAAALAGVESGGQTALFDGWQAGAAQLEAGVPGAISRVILLSDGQANVGASDLVEVAPHCAQWLAKGVSTTTVGLGHGFNEDLMVGMARAGGGQSYYGQAAQDLFDSFDEELSLLEAMFLRQLGAKAVAADGVIVEPLNALATAADGRFPMTDLAWGSESWLLLRLHVTPQAASGGALRALLSVSLQAEAKDGQAVQLISPVLALPVVSAEAFAALPEDDLVARRLLEVNFAAASTKARRLLLEDDIPMAKRTLAAFESHVAHNPWLKESLKHMQALIDSDADMAAKEIRYRTTRLETRLVGAQEADYVGDETNDAATPAYLRRKVVEGRGRKQ